MSDLGGVAKLLADEGQKNHSLVRKVGDLIETRDFLREQVKQRDEEIERLKNAIRKLIGDLEGLLG